MEENLNLKNQHIPKEGSLGLLALGDVGLRAWRKVKQELEDSNEKEA